MFSSGPRRSPYLLTLLLLFAAAPIEVDAHPGRGGMAAAASVYRVICSQSKEAGSSFGHRSGYIITAAHVVSECGVKNITVVTSSGATSAVTVADVDADLDIALLTPATDGFVVNPLPIFTESQLTIGGQISIWGYPRGYRGPEPLLAVGYLSGSERFGATKQWVVNAAINLGNSGGPVIEPITGNVIGVVSGKLVPGWRTTLEDIMALEKNETSEAQRVASTLKYLLYQTQLGFGFATVTNDLRNFLKKNGVEP